VSDTRASLRHKIDSAGELRSVVRTMKAVASSSIVQYERSVAALADYARTVELGLSVCLRHADASDVPDGARTAAHSGPTAAIVFGSDQGLVGQFNDTIADHAVQALADVPGPVKVWAVGDRVQARLADAGRASSGLFAVPAAVGAISALVTQILVATDPPDGNPRLAELYLFHNRPGSGLPGGGALYAPVTERLLPLDAAWRRGLMQRHWPTHALPEVLGSGTTTLAALIGEYLFVCLFRACAESLASENASRLAAMQRAEKNIDDVLDGMKTTSNRLRQSSIDEELFDVVSGFEALSH
jgi:F-type H+-transporting ATPase subunit gamma